MSDEVQRVKVAQSGYRMRRRRFMAGLTIYEAAPRARISVPWLSQLENERKSAGVKALERLAAVYGCEIKDLMPVDPAERDAQAAASPGDDEEQEVPKAA